MSDFRQDPITGQWVVLSEVRGVRPNEFRQVETRRSDLACPFCRGFEANTPPSLLELVDPASPGEWLVRVVPNKFPALIQMDSENGSPPELVGPYQTQQLSGRQEIIISSPRHVASFSLLLDRELDATMEAYRQRIGDMQNDPEIQHAMLFANCRSEAGASLEHIHSQLIGTPMISPNLERRLALARDQFRQSGQTTMQQVVQWEREQRDRVIIERTHWTAFCPFASRFPFQVWVVPNQHEPSLQDCDRPRLSELGWLIRDLVDRLERAHDFPAYNVMFHVADQSPESEKMYQWYVEIVPRLTRFAGYELGTGCWINHVSPNAAARQLVELGSSFENGSQSSAP